MENSRKSTGVSCAAAPSSSQNYFAWHVEPESRPTPPQIPQIKWRCPAQVALKGEWRVASGEESHEAETQRNRDYIVAEALYAHPSLIPPNPSDLLDKGGHDSRTPVIPLTPRDDAAEAEGGDSEANASANVGGLEDFDRQLWVGSAENPLFTISMVVMHLLASNPELRSTVLNFINGECTSLPTICLGVLRSVTAGRFVPCCCTVQTEDTQERIRDQAPLEENLTCGLMSNGEQEELGTDVPNGNANNLPRSPSPDDSWQGRSRLHQDEWKVERYGLSNNATAAYPSSCHQHIRPVNNDYGVLNAMNRPSTPLQFRPNVPSLGPPGPGTAYHMANSPYAPLHPPGTKSTPMMTSPPPYTLSPPSNHLVQSYAATPPNLGNQKKHKPCVYFSTAGGCRNGENCSYLHIGNVLDSQAAKRMRLG